jgi:hypothetical protein
LVRRRRQMSREFSATANKAPPFENSFFSILGHARLVD